MNILIRMPNWLGDCVMATSALESIKNEFYDASITIVCSKVAEELFRFDPKIKNVIVDDTKSNRFRSLAIKKLANKIRQNYGEFDLAFTFQNNIPSRLLLFFSGSKIRVGGKQGLRDVFLTDSIRVDKSLHQVEIYHEIVKNYLQKEIKTPRTKIYLKNTHSYNKKTLGINPGATYGSAKRWDAQKFAEVAIKLSDKYDIVIFGTEAEADIANKIVEILKFNNITNYQNFVGKTSVYMLMSMIASLDIFITNDSGPMHIAGAFEIPTVSIFGSTNHIQTAQWQNQKSVIIRKDLICSPCMKRKCPLEHHKCMKDIAAKDVLEGVLKLI